MFFNGHSATKKIEDGKMKRRAGREEDEGHVD